MSEQDEIGGDTLKPWDSVFEAQIQAETLRILLENDELVEEYRKKWAVQPSPLFVAEDLSDHHTPGKSST